MCNYTPPKIDYKESDRIEFCNYYELINSSTPKNLEALDSEGKCIFHSKNIKWKRENNFFELLFVLIKFLEEKEKNNGLTGVHFISAIENTSINYLEKLFPYNLHGAVFWDDINMSNQIINSGVNLEYCNFRSDILFEKCTFNSGVVLSSMDFYCETTGTFELKECVFEGSVDFCNTKVKGSFAIQSCKFLNPFIFIDNKFSRDGLFEVTSTFEEFTLFGNLEINSILVNFSDTYFKGETVFSNNIIQPEQQIIFSGISVEQSLLFSGEGNNRIFHGYTEFCIDFERIDGKITFQNVNLSSIREEHRQSLMQLQSTGKVIIERGCIKYRLQTEEITIPVSKNSQLLIDEITRAYTNFFISHTGRNLGVEIVERTDEQIFLFYFSDENLSQEEYLRLLQESRKTFLCLFSNFKDYLNNCDKEDYVLNGINGVISLMAVSFRAALLISLGKWKRKDTMALLNSINSSDSTLLVEEFHNMISSINLPDTIKGNIESNKLNVFNFHQINQDGNSNVYIENYKDSKNSKNFK